MSHRTTTGEINNVSTQTDKAQRFKELHERDGAFIIPNPWDIGTARVLEGFGFEALATTSSGFAHTLGRVDGEVSLDEKLAHCSALTSATSIPISADLEQCFSDNPEEAAKAITKAAQAGIVGASIEDYSGPAEDRIFDFDHAVERVRAAAEAAHALDFPFLLTARAELLIRGGTDRDDVLRRLQAFEEAGADVLYAPGLSSLEQLQEVTSALTKPFNVLAPFIKGATLDEFAQAGAKRVSVGGALARVAFGSLMTAAKEMQEEGSFDWMAGMSTSKGLDKLLAS